MNRSYPLKDVKLLFGLSASICAFPGCWKRCIEDATPHDPHAVTGKIAHIEAHSNSGPRANPALTPKQRDCYDNWILLCPTHHDIVDNQPNTYTAADLRKWKQDIEKWVRDRYKEALPKISFAELEMITQYIMESPSAPSDDIIVIPPKEKVEKNGLSEKVDRYLKLGLVQKSLVEKYVNHMEMIQPNFSVRLINGFVQEYNRLRDIESLYGDDLFFALLSFASRGNDNFETKSAGLAVLCYLFIKCEVFEK